MTSKKRLFSPEHVEWLKVDKEKLIGQGRQGKVYLGKLKFKRQKPRNVAVKFFYKPTEEEIKEVLARDEHTRFLLPDYSLMGERLGRILDIIEKFSKHGVRMPKFLVLKHEGENVLVSELFAKHSHPLDHQISTKLTELSQIPVRFEMLNKNRELSLEIARQMALMVRAGWVPRNFSDVIHVHATKKGLQGIVAEVDPLHFSGVHVPGHSRFRSAQIDPVFEFLYALRGNKKLQREAIDVFRTELHPRFLPHFNKRVKYELEDESG